MTRQPSDGVYINTAQEPHPFPHPLRCQNKCDHWIDDGTISGKCKIARYYDGTIEYKNMLFIEAVGCASHSSASDAGKVLDEFYDLLCVEKVDIFDGVSMDDIDRIYAELRTNPAAVIERLKQERGG